MRHKNPIPDAPPSEGLIGRQREVNENLVLAGIRAQEETDVALEQKRTAEALAADLAAAAEFRERLIGIIGHDLRNPLNAMVMAAELQLRRGNLNAEDEHLANRISVTGRRMARMISQLADFTRARLGGGFELSLRPSNLAAICEDIADELRISSSHEVVVSSEGDVEGTWDADRLSQVISNLASNAVSHATAGTPIYIRAHCEGPDVVVDVENQGQTIPAELVSVIFKPFHRANREEDAGSEHLGLGLYIAHEMARSHGGGLAVRSENGTTTFTLTVPSTPPRSSQRNLRVAQLE